MNYNEIYPNIITPVKYHKNNEPFFSQKLCIKCDCCDNTTRIRLSLFLKKQSGKNMCRSCSSKTSELKILHLRKCASAQKGKTYNELYGDQKAIIIKKSIGNSSRGKDMSKCHQAAWLSNKNKPRTTWAEMHGEEKAREMKLKRADKCRGINNPMFGKPAPQKSGNGVCGWYKGWYFRSLLELSFMINYIERYDLEWKSAEVNEYKVSFINYDGNKRNYFPDFILNNEILAEIKPFKLIQTPLIQLKSNAAKEFCQHKKLKYQIFSEKDFQKLNQQEILELYKTNKIKLLKDKHIKHIIEYENKRSRCPKYW